MWQAVSEKLQVLKKSLDEGDQGALGEIRKTVLGLVAPAELVCHIVFFCYNRGKMLRFPNRSVPL